MQVSEIYRRGIVLPLVDAAEEDLRYNDIEPTTAVRCLKITTDQLFANLWNSGVFEQINNLCGSLINDYEQDFVESSQLKKLRNVVEEAIGGASNRELKDFLISLRELANSAILINRPLLFVL
jgi:hypothetical protein